MKLSLATNACASDAPRLRLVVPSWQRSFGDRFDELVVVLDPLAPSGRIADLHGSLSAGALEEVRDVLEDLAASDPRIRIEVLDDAALEATARRWFVSGRPLRCQVGTPILAFTRAFDVTKPDRVVLRADCDMVFHEAGWLEEAFRRFASGSVDLLEPSRLRQPPYPGYPVTSRALLLDKGRFYRRCLPMRPHRVDPLRRVHRWWHGREPWLALEQMLAVEVASGRIRHGVLPDELGCSMHISTRAEAGLPEIARIVAAFERGAIADEQLRAGWNFEADAWRHYLRAAPAVDAPGRE